MISLDTIQYLLYVKKISKDKKCTYKNSDFVWIWISSQQNALKVKLKVKCIIVVYIITLITLGFQDTEKNK